MTQRERDEIAIRTCATCKWWRVQNEAIINQLAKFWGVCDSPGMNEQSEGQFAPWYDFGCILHEEREGEKT